MSQVAMRKEESEGSAAELPVTVYTPDSEENGRHSFYQITQY